MRLALLTIFGWLLRGLAVFIALGACLAQYLVYTKLPTPHRADAYWASGQSTALALEVIFFAAIYAIGSKLLELRNNAGGTPSVSAETSEG